VSTPRVFRGHLTNPSEDGRDQRRQAAHIAHQRDPQLGFVHILDPGTQQRPQLMGCMAAKQQTTEIDEPHAALPGSRGLAIGRKSLLAGGIAATSTFSA
jgi:hypothetical protein